LRFHAARPQTRLEAAAQRPGTPSARLQAPCNAPSFFQVAEAVGPHPPQQASTTRGTNWRPWPWQSCSVF
jgi:hypothetical protein